MDNTPNNTNPDPFSIGGLMEGLGATDFAGAFVDTETDKPESPTPASTTTTSPDPATSSTTTTSAFDFGGLSGLDFGNISETADNTGNAVSGTELFNTGGIDFTSGTDTDSLLDQLDTTEETENLFTTTEVQQGRSKKFDGKFYINYHAFSPLVILKENPKLLAAVIASDPDKIKLNYLVRNIMGNYNIRQNASNPETIPVIEGFIDYMLNNFNDRIDNYQTMKELLGKDIPDGVDFRTIYDELKGKVKKSINSTTPGIIDKFLENWKELYNTINLYTVTTSGTVVPIAVGNMLKTMNQGNRDLSGGAGLLAVFRVTERPKDRNNLSSGKVHPLVRTNQLLYENYGSIGEYSGFMLNIYDILKSRLSTRSNTVVGTNAIAEYNSNNYRYGTLNVKGIKISETKILKLLGFPTSMAGYESVLKERCGKKIGSGVSDNTTSRNDSETYKDNPKFIGFYSNGSILHRIRKNTIATKEILNEEGFPIF